MGERGHRETLDVVGHEEVAPVGQRMGARGPEERERAARAHAEARAGATAASPSRCDRR